MQASNDAERVANHLTVAFKTQVKDWKNTLLGGKDPEALETLWTAFKNFSARWNNEGKLVAALSAGHAEALTKVFAAAHAMMGQRCDKGFEASKAERFDAAEGDAAIRGIDRALAKLLNEPTTRSLPTPLPS